MRNSIFLSKNYILTYITEFAVLISGILVYKLAAGSFGKEGFNEYSICRRTLSFIQPLLIMGLGVGLPRYIAIAAAGDLRKKISSYFYSALIIMAIVLLIASLAFMIFDRQLSYLFFGTESYYHLIYPLIIMLCGMVFHSLCYSFFRGEMRMNSANIMQLLNLGLVPMIIFLFGKDIYQVLLLTGLSWLFISAGFFLYIAFNLKPEKDDLFESAKELLRYGLQRVPGDVALGAFFALPTYFIAHYVNDNLDSAGNAAFAISLLNMIGAAFGPICLLLLPQASKAIANRDYSSLQKYSKEILVLTLVVSGLGLVFVEIFASPLITIYMNGNYPGLVEVVRIVMPACVGYAVYISLRSILDAYHVKAVNTRNIFFCFILFTVLVFINQLIGYGYYYILIAFGASLSLLGVLTYIETSKIFKNNKQEDA
jgi:O-antigen/teichoic acid export membrane protein